MRGLMHRFWSYDPVNQDVDFHATEAEARDAALAVLEAAGEDSDGGWPEDVEAICWGEVRESVTLTWKRDLTDEEAIRHPDWTFYADAELRPVASEPARREEA